MYPRKKTLSTVLLLGIFLLLQSCDSFYHRHYDEYSPSSYNYKNYYQDSGQAQYSRAGIPSKTMQ